MFDLMMIRKMNFLKLIFSTSGQDQFKNVAESAASVAVSSLRVFLIYFFIIFLLQHCIDMSCVMQVDVVQQMLEAWCLVEGA